jgi:hypothetical protein
MLQFVKRHPLAVTLSSVIGVPVVLLALWTAITLSYTYSSGDRAGFLQKLSQRGWLCKTWEGEMQLTAIPGAAPEKFIFSVRSDSIAAEANKLLGKPVVLHYEQHRRVPTSCFGDTEYFITAVRPVTTP